MSERGLRDGNAVRKSTSFNWPRLAPQIEEKRLQTLAAGDNHLALESYCAASPGTTYNYVNIGPLSPGVEHLGNYVLDIPGQLRPGYACFGFKSLSRSMQLHELELQGHAKDLYIGVGDAHSGVYRWSGPLCFGRASAERGCQGSIVFPLPTVLSRSDAGRSYLTFALPLGSYAQISSIRVSLADA
ncbi:hypothetical protein IT575_12345 [bacterium]|nr:hypothetical protein [bacterium]